MLKLPAQTPVKCFFLQKEEEHYPPLDLRAQPADPQLLGRPQLSKTLVGHQASGFGYFLLLPSVPHPFILSFFALLGFELRAFTLSHSTSPFCVRYY
jgi:hypothetical protein